MQRDSFESIRHEIKNSLSHISGYSELLREDLTEFGWSEFLNEIEAIQAELKVLREALRRDLDGATEGEKLPELQRRLSSPLYAILAAAANIRSFMHTARVEEVLPDVHGIIFAASRVLELLNRDLETSTARAPEPELYPVPADVAGGRGTLLLIDDDSAFRGMFVRLFASEGYRVLEAAGGDEAFALIAGDAAIDAVVLDLLLGDEDGFDLLRRLTDLGVNDSSPILVMSGIGEVETVARAIEAGAVDFLDKELDPVVWKARIGAALERKRLLDAEREYLRAIIDYQERLREELADAAEYVMSLLPAPLAGGPVLTDWFFKPSEKLGGDNFGYHRREDGSFVLFMVDVTGHGIGSALHAVAVAHLLRTESPGDAEAGDPEAVLRSLNRRLPMESHNELYFTLFYGVYVPRRRRLVYAAAGMVPGLLLRKGGGSLDLESNGPVIGMNPEAEFGSREIPLEQGDQLILYSDGLYEFELPGGGEFGRDRLNELLAEGGRRPGVDWIPEAVRKESDGRLFEDDITILKVVFEE